MASGSFFAGDATGVGGLVAVTGVGVVVSGGRADAPRARFDQQTDVFTRGPRRFTAGGQPGVSLPITLARNAVVRRFDVRIQAARGEGVALGAVADVRPESDGKSVVIDFGLMRTVSGLQVPTAFKVERVHAWNGAGFAADNLVDSTRGPEATVRFSEIRTERIRFTTGKPIPERELLEATDVILPEPPADLELRIGGGAPIWTHPGAVQPGEAGPANADDWNDKSEILVPIAAALDEWTGDPTSGEELTHELTLTARVPGLLDLQPQVVELSQIDRTQFNDSNERDLDFASEGRVEINLGLAGLRLIEEVRLTVAGEPGPERVVEPVDAEATEMAELVADPDHAFCVRLSDQQLALAEIQGIRLPVVAGASGAEARVLLWTSDDDGEPLDALEGGASEPLVLDGSSPWTTFPFSEPVAPQPGLWVAVLVTRGQLVWVPSNASPEDATDLHDLRRGVPTGDWQPLPEVTLPSGAPLRLRGRVRATGLAGEDAPLAALQVSLAKRPDVVIGMTPAANGLSGRLTFEPPFKSSSASLVIISRIASSFVLRDVDVVWRPLPVAIFEGDKLGLDAPEIPTVRAGI